MTTPDRLHGYLRGYSAEYPGAWKTFENFRADRGKGLPRWPEWCWCPLAASYAIVSGGGDSRVPLDRQPDVGILGALGAWRMTQGIYRFDADVFAALWTTPLDRLPTDVFYHLPEWCVYIDAPPGYSLNIPLLGWFAHLEWDAETARPELRLVLEFGDTLHPFVIHLTAPTLAGCVEATVAETQRQARIMKIPIRGFEAGAQPQDVDVLTRSLAPIVSVVLYLCSEAADIADLRGKREQPGNPMPVKTKRGLRTFPADGPTVWLTGYRIGAALRLADRREATDTGGGTHASPRPHIRRAHWHSFWLGPRDGERQLVARWLPPIAVGRGDLVPTIHRVK